MRTKSHKLFLNKWFEKHHFLSVFSERHMVRCIPTFCDTLTQPLPGGSFALPCERGRSLLLVIWMEREQRKRQSARSVRNGTVGPWNGASNLLKKDTAELHGPHGWLQWHHEHRHVHTHTSHTKHRIQWYFPYVTIFFWQLGLSGLPRGGRLQGPLSVYVTL